MMCPKNLVLSLSTFFIDLLWGGFDAAIFHGSCNQEVISSDHVTIEHMKLHICDQKGFLLQYFWKHEDTPLTNLFRAFLLEISFDGIKWVKGCTVLPPAVNTKAQCVI